MAWIAGQEADRAHEYGTDDSGEFTQHIVEAEKLSCPGGWDET